MSFLKILSHVIYLLQHGELAVIIDDKLTGKPRRDPITGSLKNHHLGNSDVSLQVYYKGVIFPLAHLRRHSLAEKKTFVFKQRLALLITNMCTVLKLDQ